MRRTQQVHGEKATTHGTLGDLRGAEEEATQSRLLSTREPLNHNIDGARVVMTLPLDAPPFFCRVTPRRARTGETGPTHMPEHPVIQLDRCDPEVALLHAVVLVKRALEDPIGPEVRRYVRQRYRVFEEPVVDTHDETRVIPLATKSLRSRPPARVCHHDSECPHAMRVVDDNVTHLNLAHMPPVGGSGAIRRPQDALLRGDSESRTLIDPPDGHALHLSSHGRYGACRKVKLTSGGLRSAADHVHSHGASDTLFRVIRRRAKPGVQGRDERARRAVRRLRCARKVRK